MKIIKSFWEDLIEVWCSAIGCEDKLIIRIDKDYKKYAKLRLPLPSEESFYFEMKYDEDRSLRTRIKKAWNYVRYNKRWDMILFNTYQVKEMAEILLRKIEEIEEAYKEKLPPSKPEFPKYKEIIEGKEEKPQKE